MRIVRGGGERDHLNRLCGEYEDTIRKYRRKIAALEATIQQMKEGLPYSTVCRIGMRELVGRLDTYHGDDLAPVLVRLIQEHLTDKAVALIRSGKANLQARTKGDNTVLTWAATVRDYRVVAALLAAGTLQLRVNNTNAGNVTALMMMASDRGAYCDQLLAVAKAMTENTEAVSATFGRTALHHACAHGHWALVDYLLGLGRARCGISEDVVRALLVHNSAEACDAMVRILDFDDANALLSSESVLQVLKKLVGVWGDRWVPVVTKMRKAAPRSCARI